MLKTIPERITYAQERLIKLVEARKLRRWCLDNGLTHAAVYRLALGEQQPTFKTLASMCHLIAPIEWLFYTDETLPYEPQLLPRWDADKPSKFVKAHRFDYKVLAANYALTELSAYNIFVAYRARPTPLFIRAACAEANPTDFFTDDDVPVQKSYVPARGDIVGIDGKVLLVISRAEDNERLQSFTGCAIVAECADGIALEGATTRGAISPSSLHSFPLVHLLPVTLIEKAGAHLVERTLQAVAGYLS